ncbi:palmitoyl-acyl carrier protein thioesterase, chloroplastic-like [Rutidosis leptorrhynchoides]|uniref:palmitoyl-acyl carrier protein thioesterase, chloroplastic-like n=1 Tax=Rutidosis leptorrhynchoides TaxID=125765 RepID=UPI003A990A33
MSATTISCLQISSKHNISFGNLSSASKLRCKLDNVNKCGLSDTSSLCMQAKSNISGINDAYSSPSSSSSLSTTTFGVMDSNLLLSEILLGRMVSDYVFRQGYKIRLWETGPGHVALLETLMNFIQEALVNRARSIGVLSDDMNSTRVMSKHKLVWVVTKLQLEVDRYPTWDDVVYVDHWGSTSGKNAMCGTWLIRDSQTGEILVKASSHWIVMNKETRRLCKIPDDVRVELAPTTIDTPPVIQENDIQYKKFDTNEIVHVRHGLLATWKDLDANQHVNNVKYTGWILESVPDWIMEKYELESMTLEFRRECMKGSVVQSQTLVLENDNSSERVDCQHQLQFEGGSSGVILKGMTIWRPKREYYLSQ